jgi:hypothetical protein
MHGVMIARMEAESVTLWIIDDDIVWRYIKLIYSVFKKNGAV